MGAELCHSQVLINHMVSDRRVGQEGLFLQVCPFMVVLQPAILPPRAEDLLQIKVSMPMLLASGTRTFSVTFKTVRIDMIQV